jgi:glycosyltransferase involved in cell wall biosynthesis
VAVKFDDPFSPLTVDYDDEVFFLQPRGGISRYFTEIVEQFQRDPALGIQAKWTFTRTDNEILKGSRSGAGLSALRPAPRQVQRLAGKWQASNQALRTWQVGKETTRPGKFLHATYWAPTRLNLEAHKQLAVSVMDLIPEKQHAVAFGGRFGGREALLRRASVVFTISDATRTELLDRYSWLEVPVITTHLAADRRVFNTSVTAPVKSPYPYALFVGNRSGYKNFSVFVSAVAQVRARGLDIGIIAAGPPASSQEAALARSLNPSDRVRFCQPTDSELADLYRAAEVFVFPSAMEGFGLPIVEAMACGCPVVLSDIEVFHEVAGTAGKFAEANSHDDLARAIEEVLSSSSTRQSLAASGRARADAFTWRNTAALTAAGYRMVCHE